MRRVAAKKPASLKRLAADEDLQDIVSRNLERAIKTESKDLAAFGKAVLAPLENRA